MAQNLTDFMETHIVTKESKYLARHWNQENIDPLIDVSQEMPEFKFEAWIDMP